MLNNNIFSDYQSSALLMYCCFYSIKLLGINVCNDGSSMFQEIVVDDTVHIPLNTKHGFLWMVFWFTALSHFMITTVGFWFLLTGKSHFSSSVVIQCKNERLAFLTKRLQKVERCSILKRNPTRNLNSLFASFPNWTQKCTYKRYTVEWKRW